MSDSMTVKDRLMFLPLEKLQISKFNVRKKIQKEDLKLLADSIKEIGVLQPLIVKPLPEGKYEVIAGQRRLIAARAVGIKVVPCIVKHNLEQEDEILISLSENLARKELNPIEKAKALEELYKVVKKKGKVNSVYQFIKLYSSKLGIRKTQIYALLKLLRLPSSLKEKVEKGLLGVDAALRYFSKEYQLKGDSFRSPEKWSSLFLRCGRYSISLSPPPTVRTPEEVLRLAKEVLEKAGFKYETSTKGLEQRN